jgi:MoxR-like ATPase
MAYRRMEFYYLVNAKPTEQEGTYRLPEAQLDRFLFSIPSSFCG